MMVYKVDNDLKTKIELNGNSTQVYETRNRDIHFTECMEYDRRKQSFAAALEYNALPKYKIVSNY